MYANNARGVDFLPKITYKSTDLGVGGPNVKKMVKNVRKIQNLKDRKNTIFSTPMMLQQ